LQLFGYNYLYLKTETNKNTFIMKSYKISFNQNVGTQKLRKYETLNEDQLKELKEVGEFRKGIFGKLIKLENVVKIEEDK